MRHRGSHRFIAFVLGLLVGSAALWVFAAANAAPQVAVKDVRVWAGPDGTRLVFDLSSPAAHSLLTLQNPDRVVVDIATARLDNDTLAFPSEQGFVKQVRVGPQDNGDLRFVIDLSAPAVPNAFAVEPNGNYGHRLVLDLKPSLKAAPAQPTVVKSTDEAHGRDIVVAIDAGHGGNDPGAIGRTGAREKDVTLAIARRLKERIDREPGMTAILTRSGDYFLPHRERIRRARDKQADMFISVHADSFNNRAVTGSSVYTLSARGASDEAARWLAERENAADLVGGVSLEDKGDVLASVLLDLSQGASMSASIEAAEKVMNELDRIDNVTRRGVKQAPFLVLKSPDIPSMLIETAFISNPAEEARLKDPKHQQRVADAIHAGVRNYFYTNPPPGTRVAQLRTQGGGRAVVASADANPDSTVKSAAGTGQ